MKIHPTIAVPFAFFSFTVQVILRFISSRLKGYETYDFIILGSCENRQFTKNIYITKKNIYCIKEIFINK